MLTVHRAERADALAAALADLLTEPLPDPFGSEMVAVPAKGVERWLAQRLSHRLGAGPDGGDGVCAGVEFPSPAALLDAVVATAVGTEPDDDPWQPARLAWPLLEVIDAAAGEPWCAPLGAHLGGDGPGDVRRGRRYATARRLAELFAGYAVHRPELLTGWAAGAGAAGDLGWQPELWRRLRERVGGLDPAHRLAAACAALRADPGRAALPARLSVFGPTRLPAAHLAVLVALAEHRDVHLWLPHPSPALWDRVAELTGGAAVVPRRRADPSAAAARHPLLSSLGRDVRELQVRLAAAAPHAQHRHHPRAEPPPTLLGRLQRRLRDDHPPGRPEPLADGDRSVQVHACHGPHRQVEVLREVIVGLLADDETLQPRDVLVMCPDVETFAPLVSAAFGLSEPGPDRHPGQRLPVRLADRALRQVNPLLDTVATLLELADTRVTAAQALDLLASAPVRLRFRLDDAELDRLRVLAARAGRALGAGRRAPRPLPAAGLPAEHLGRRAGPAAARGDHVGRRRRGRRAALAGHRTAAGRRRVRGHHAGRTARRVRRPAGRGARRTGRRAPADRLDRDPEPERWTSSPTPPRRRPGRARRPGPSWPPRCARRARTPPGCRSGCPTCARCWPTGCADARPGPASAPARSRWPPWSRCARCRTGWCACSGSTTGCSRGRPCRTATTCWPGTRWWASGTRAARTANCCSTPCARPPSGWSSCTPGPTSGPGPGGPPRSRWVSCWTRSRPRPGPRTRCWSGTRCSPSTHATSPPASWPPGGRSASTGPSWPARWPPPARSDRRPPSCRRRWIPPRPRAAPSGWTSW